MELEFLRRTRGSHCVIVVEAFCLGFRARPLAGGCLRQMTVDSTVRCRHRWSAPGRLTCHCMVALVQCAIASAHNTLYVLSNVRGAPRNFRLAPACRTPATACIEAHTRRSVPVRWRRAPLKRQVHYSTIFHANFVRDDPIAHAIAPLGLALHPTTCVVR